MNIKKGITQVICDKDLRDKFLRIKPNLFNNFFVTNTGEILTKKELEKVEALNYFLAGLNLVDNAMAMA